MGKAVSRSTKLMRDGSAIHPSFDFIFDEKLHGPELNSRLKLPANLSPAIKARLLALIKKYFCCFIKANVPITINDYECHIDTGDAAPIVAKNIRFGIHETPIMQRAIDGLLQKNQIVPDTESQWLSRPVLAPKPHQEDITSSRIDDFEWRFCISYIPLNSVTKLLPYPIPRCDDATEMKIGNAAFKILMDAFSGYHQIKMAHASSFKTAFSGPGGRKYRLTVMPFGPVNGPVIFVIMIYDLKDHWDSLASQWGVILDNFTNSIIIIDDTFIFSNDENTIFLYLESILEISKRYNLSWKLEKCEFFSERFEFVGTDIASAGNCPAKSKTPLFKMWRTKRPTTTRDFASFIGLIGFYRNWIPYFEKRISTIRKLMIKHDYDYKLSDDDLTPAVYAEMHDLLNAVMSDPILQRADINKRFYLRSDACAIGHGNVLLQPGNDAPSLAAMRREINGADCEFELTVSSELKLHPLGFAARKCVLNEKYLHSFMSEPLGLSFGIQKWRPFLWGRQFTAIVDCRAMQWLDSYEGDNAAVRRLQFNIVGYNFTCKHRPEYLNKDADGLSRLGIDTTLGPNITGVYSDNEALDTYFRLACQLSRDNPCPTGEVTPHGLPGFRHNAKKYATKPVLLQPATPTPVSSLTYIPVSFHKSTRLNTDLHLFNNTVVRTAYAASKFEWIIHGFGSGTFFDSIHTNSFPYVINAAVDTTSSGRSMLQSFGKVPNIFPSSLQLMAHIKTQLCPNIHAYFITVPQLTLPSDQRLFFQQQLNIISWLQHSKKLILFLCHYSASTGLSSRNSFEAALRQHSWLLSSQCLDYTDFGDSIADSSTFLFGINTLALGPDESTPLQVIHPPPVDVTISNNLIGEYNLDKFALITQPLLPDEPNENSNFKLEPLINAIPHSKYCHPTHRLLYKACPTPSHVGTLVCHVDHPAPPLQPENVNIFQGLFGIAYQCSNTTFIRCISRYEYGKCFGLSTTYNKSLCPKSSNYAVLRHGCPGNTMTIVLEHCMEKLLSIRDAMLTSNAQISHNQTAPAATAFNILNGTTSVRLPSKEAWLKAYSNDKDCSKIIEFIANPGTVTNKAIQAVHFKYRQPLRQSNIIHEGGYLFLKEHISKDTFVKLRIVPTDLRNIIFLAFHSNPIGGHYSLYYTFHRIRLRYFWPSMYAYLKVMCRLCAGCGLANSFGKLSSELVYSFPMDAPFKVICGDIYKAGDIKAYHGVSALFIIQDLLSGFAIIEELTELNSDAFIRVAMKVLLQHGLCHTFVVDADSKFRSIFEHVMLRLKINLHVASGGNHDAIIVERFNAFLNKGLKIFCNERDTTRVFVEGAQLLAYA